MNAPSADSQQSNVLDNLINLAQSASLDSVNQIAMLNRQISDME